MKILFLTNSLDESNGWGRYSIDLVSSLAKKGITCRVLTTKGAKNKVLPAVEVFDVMSSNPASFLRYLFVDYLKIKKYCDGFDLVHSLIEPYGPLACLLAGKKRPFFITSHGTFAVNWFKKIIPKIIFRLVFKKAAKIFSVSNFTKRKIIERVKLGNIEVINNGVDYRKFQLDNFVAKKDDNSKIILGVGALKSRKGFHISIPAVAKAKEKFNNLKYYIVGGQSDVAYFNKLKQLVADLHLSNAVFFLQDISDDELIRLYHQMDLFLLTPVNVGDKFEGFGLVYLEAGACGKPVIGTYNCGAEEAIIENYNGLLVPQEDINQTAAAIVRILENNMLAESLGKNGRSRAIDMNWDKIADKYIDCYKTAPK